MSSHAKNLKAFIFLLDNQPSLFDSQVWADLNQLSYSLPEEDIEQVSDAISAWCKAHRGIYKALIAAHNQLPESESPTRVFDGSVDPIEPKEQNEMLVTTLKNKIRRSSQTSDYNSNAPKKTGAET